jgi:hypothetical protein
MVLDPGKQQSLNLPNFAGILLQKRGVAYGKVRGKGATQVHDVTKLPGKTHRLGLNQACGGILIRRGACPRLSPGEEPWR